MAVSSPGPTTILPDDSHALSAPLNPSISKVPADIWSDIFGYVPLYIQKCMGLLALNVFIGKYAARDILLNHHGDMLFQNKPFVHHMFCLAKSEGHRRPRRYTPTSFVAGHKDGNQTFDRLIKNAKDKKNTEEVEKMQTAKCKAWCSFRRQLFLMVSIDAAYQLLVTLAPHKGRYTCRGCLQELSKTYFEKFGFIRVPLLCYACLSVHLQNFFIKSYYTGVIDIERRAPHLSWLKLIWPEEWLSPVSHLGTFYTPEAAQSWCSMVHRVPIEVARQLEFNVVVKNNRKFTFYAASIKEILSSYSSEAIQVVMQLYALSTADFGESRLAMNCRFIDAIRIWLLETHEQQFDTLASAGQAVPHVEVDFKDIASQFWFQFAHYPGVLARSDGRSVWQVLEDLVASSGVPVAIQTNLGRQQSTDALPDF